MTNASVYKFMDLFSTPKLHVHIQTSYSKHQSQFPIMSWNKEFPASLKFMYTYIAKYIYYMYMYWPWNDAESMHAVSCDSRCTLCICVSLDNGSTVCSCEFRNKHNTKASPMIESNARKHVRYLVWYMF